MLGRKSGRCKTFEAIGVDPSGSSAGTVSGCRPGIDKGYSTIGKVPNIACREPRPSGSDDRSDLPVDLTDRPSHFSATDSDLGIGHGRIRIEGEDTSSHVPLEDWPGRRGQGLAASSVQKQSEALKDLGLCQRGREDDPSGMPGEPGADTNFRRGAHQLRDHVGIENDHSKTGGSRLASRGISGRSTPPSSANRSWIT